MNIFKKICVSVGLFLLLLVSSYATKIETDSITWNGATISGNMVFVGTQTCTFIGNGIVTGQVNLMTNAVTLNKTTAETFTCGGLQTSSGSPAGNLVSVTITGGTLSNDTVSRYMPWPIIIAAGSNTVTLGTYLGIMNGITYTSGTISGASSVTLTASTNNQTISTNGITWGTFQHLTTGLIFTLGNDFQCTNTTYNGSYSVSFTGANMTIANLVVQATGTSRTFKIPSTYTTTITTSLMINANTTGMLTFSSYTASSTANLVYNGAASALRVFGYNYFTDIAYSGSNQTFLPNWYGSTLLRTSGIYNVTLADIPAIGDVRLNTVYFGALTGTLNPGGGGTTSDIFGWM